MNKKLSVNDKVKSNLRLMEVGDVYSWPARKLSVVRTIASALGFELSAKFSVNCNRETQCVDVTRTE